MRIAPVTISFFSYENSVQLIARLLEYVPEITPIILDNNPTRDEYGFEDCCGKEAFAHDVNSRILYRRNTKKPDIKVRSHGLGMDFALDFCKEYNFDWMLHIEPDCKITGRVWYDAITDAAIINKCDVVAMFKTTFGPIHPCLSFWRVRSIKHSFKLQPMDITHPRFREFVSLPALLRETKPPKNARIKLEWDTAQKNWFEAAVKDRCVIVENPGDISHKGWSSKRF